MGVDLANLAHVLSGLRLANTPFLLYFSWTNRPTLFLLLLAISLLSDMVDGWIARKSDQASLLGAKLDSWGDFATYLTVPLCAWWLWPDLLRQEAPFVLVVVVSYLLPVTVGFLKYGRLTSYHTWGAKISAVLIGGSGFLMLAGGPVWPFEWVVPILALAALEEIALTVLFPKWRSNVPTFWHGLRLIRDSNSPSG